MPDPLAKPKEWVRVCATGVKEPLHWWHEFTMLNWEHVGKVPTSHTVVGQETGHEFCLPMDQFEETGWRNSSLSLANLWRDDFLLPTGLWGSQGI